MPHRPQTQNGGITKPGRKSVIQIVTAWIVKIHREVSIAQLHIEQTHHRL
jgi:hypothetical protein